jgi:hypothetical protein
MVSVHPGHEQQEPYRKKERTKKETDVVSILFVHFVYVSFVSIW